MAIGGEVVDEQFVVEVVSEGGPDVLLARDESLQVAEDGVVEADIEGKLLLCLPGGDQLWILQ